MSNTVKKNVQKRTTKLWTESLRLAKEELRVIEEREKLLRDSIITFTELAREETETDLPSVTA
ncbi:MAG TPA: hypothetical protein VJW20_14180 [Candidatus Angelobacter sp.]|nr:hypothetical protein [Candidatus Angelobacter sp.]